jgi:DNA-binding transcriptional LysR family regulator
LQINRLNLTALFAENEQFDVMLSATFPRALPMHAVDAIRIFVRVAELTSFTAAADRLGLPKASASTAVRDLEAQLGTQLLHRTTRKVQMTQDGRQFYERCRDLLADLDEAQTMFEQTPQMLSGRLRVDMSSGVARNLVIPRLPQFLAAHPRLELELGSTDRRVDLIREGFDCVLRVGAIGDGSLIARPLGAFPILNCASPDYLRRHGTPERIEDLDGHILIHYLATFGGKPEGLEYRDDDGVYRTREMPGALIVNSAEAYQAACLAGLGLIQAPAPGVRALIERGELIEVLPQHRAEPMPVTLLHPQRRHLARRVRAFMDWLADVLAPHVIEIDIGVR